MPTVPGPKARPGLSQSPHLPGRLMLEVQPGKVPSTQHPGYFLFAQGGFIIAESFTGRTKSF